MKKLLALLLAAIMITSMVPAMAATEYDVTEPITITWWHAHESSFQDELDYIVNKFNAENTMGITVVPQYIGSYTEINTQFIAAAAAGTGTVPAIVTCNTSYPAGYGADGLCEVLDPYIDAFEYDVEDFGEGLIASTSFDGEQIALPYLISTQCIYYNKTAAQEEGITIPPSLTSWTLSWRRPPCSTRTAPPSVTASCSAAGTTGTMRCSTRTTASSACCPMAPPT